MLNLTIPKENMQSFYSIRKSEAPYQEKSANEIPVKKNKKNLNNHGFDINQWGPIELFREEENYTQIAINDLDSDASHGEAGLKPVKSFKDMDIKEKLHYLQNYPKHLKPVVCEYVTEERSYRGYFQQFINEEVTIFQFDKTIKTFRLDKIKRIHMLGFR